MGSTTGRCSDVIAAQVSLRPEGFRVQPVEFCTAAVTRPFRLFPIRRQQIRFGEIRRRGEGLSASAGGRSWSRTSPTASSRASGAQGGAGIRDPRLRRSGCWHSQLPCDRACSVLGTGQASSACAVACSAGWSRRWVNHRCASRRACPFPTKTRMPDGAVDEP